MAVPGTHLHQPSGRGARSKGASGWLVPPLSSAPGTGEEVPTLRPAPAGVQGPDAVDG